MSVGRRLVHSFGASLLGPALTAVLQVVNVPLMLRAWGPQLFGEWLLLSTVPTYLLLSDLGFGNVAASDMALRVSGGDHDGALATFQSTQWLIGGISVAVAGGVAALCWMLPLRAVLHLTAMSLGEARRVVLLLCLNCLLLLQWSLLMAGYRATGRFARGTLLVNAVRVVEGASIFAVLFHGSRPWHLALLMLLVSTGGTAVLVLDLRRTVPWLRPGRRHARGARVRELWRPAAAFMAIPAANALSTQGMTTVVGIVLGPLAVSVFNPMRTLARIVLQGTNAVTNSVWPELSAAFGAGDVALARRLHRSACQVSLALAAAGIAVLALAGPALFGVWTHHRLTMDVPAFELLLLATGAYAAWNASSAVPMAANRHGRMAMLYLCCTVAALVAAAALAPVAGLRGVALAALGCDLAMAAVVVRISTRMVADPWRSFGAGLLSVEPLRALGARLAARRLPRER